mmetsp:Transcript_30843/g.56637  ORF Transcript_30843/g.56637 Transcript_30843/m.56637 type:complete len:563 (-) Transcript_30843:68-1756(-)
MAMLSSICLLCLAQSATVLAAAQDASCQGPVHGEFPSGGAASNTCDLGPNGRGLLQTSSERLSHPAFAAGEEAKPSTMLDQVSASKTASSNGQEASVKATAGSRVKGITGLLSFGRGITSAAEHMSVQAASGKFEELVEPSLAGASGNEDGYSMTASVGDVSSVLTLEYPASRGSDPHRRLMLVEDSAQALRSVGLLAVLVIIIVSIFVVLLAGFAGSRGDDDRSEIFSSDSEKFGSAPYSKSRMSPKMPGRYGVRREEPPRRMEPPHDQFSPAPSMRQPMREEPPQSQQRFSPIPPGRTMGKGGSPYAPQAQPYTRMQQPMQPPPPSNTQMMAPPPEPMPPPPETGGGASRPPTTSGSSRHLCPGLVVPRGNECVLAVPTLRALNVPPRNTAAFFVRDLGGKPVIQAEILVQPWTSLGAGVGQRPIAVLRTAISQGDEPATISDLSPLLAYVKASFEAGGRRSAYVYDARDEIFAHVAKDPFRSCYVLTSSRMGVQVIFTGTFGDHHVNVTNEARESLAEVEPCTTNFDPSGDYYKIRVVSHVDVGLILCGLLAIEHMEAS